MDIGSKIKYLREKNKIERNELAEKLDITYHALAKYETNDRQPDYETIRKIADFFNVTTDYLLGRTNATTTNHNTEAIKKIDSALEDDPELLDFWLETKKRPDLQLFLKQVKSVPPKAIRQMIAIIKAIEEEEERED